MIEMIENKEVCIYIGYLKTVTTTLQNYLFPSHSEISYLREESKDFSFIKEIFFSRENHLKRNIDTYKNKLFGKENICVLVFEEFKENKENYIKKLCDFMDINYVEALKLVSDNKTNSRSSRSGYKSDERSIVELLSFYKNKYFGSKSFGLSNTWLFKKIKSIYIPGKTLHDIIIDESYQKKLENIYKSGNKKLSERYDLNLKQYGYYYE